MIVIVSGPPGAGKTTIARRLADRRARSVHLESDEFYRWIIGGFVAPHLAEASGQNTTVIDLATDVCLGYQRAGYDVFWDGVVGPWWLDRIADRLGEHAATTHWLVLRPERTVGLDRVRTRDDTDDVSGAAVMAHQFADLDGHERYVLGADGGIDQVVESCDRAIAAGTHALRVP